MKLVNAILRPGIVREVLENGQIKASAPGLFSQEDKLEDLPPIFPFNELIGSHSNSFSKPEMYEEVWILNLTDNPLQLYWFRKDPHESNNSNIDIKGEHVEILCNREAGCSWASLYFTNGEGWVISYNGGSLKITKDGHIKLGLDLPHRTITIEPGGVYVGGDSHPAAYGDVTANIIRKILSGITQACMTAGLANPFTSPLAGALIANLSKITLDTEDLCSNHVKID